MANIITVQDVATKMMNQEAIFILDVRNKDEFEDWKIEGRNVQTINEPYFNLLDGVESIEDQLEIDQEIIVVCAKGGSSEMVVDLLEEAGLTNAYSLEGGMKAWSEHLEPVKVADLADDGSLYQFIRLGKGCLSYFIESNGEAAVIDTARMIDVYEQFANERNVKITHVLDTHLHADHISGGRKLAERTGATYYLPAKDATEVTFAYTPVEEGKDIQIGSTTVHVQPIYSPGHTAGSTSFIVDGQFLLTGDILFVRSIGRPDLAGQAEDWVGDLRTTLYNRYKNLSDDLIVLPAHYSFTDEQGEDGIIAARLGDLYERNTGLQVDDEQTFKEMVTEDLPPQPNAYEDIRKMNMGKLTLDTEEQREMETGPNRCAVEG